MSKRDVFICHTSEDKANVAEPLAKHLEDNGVSVWLDKNEIKWGSSIIKEVSEGLQKCEFVIVILSRAFLRKNWPQRELETSLNQEASDGKVRVLPLVVGDTSDIKEILEQYPLLSDKAYLRWEQGLDHIVWELKKLILPDKSHTSSLTSRVASTSPYYMPTVKKEFTQREKDLFLKGAFGDIKAYFKGALDHLESLNPSIETDYEEDGSSKFSCKIYVNGDTSCACRIRLGETGWENSIAYSEGRRLTETGVNELLSVKVDGAELKLDSVLGIEVKNDGLSPEQAALVLWKRFVRPLEN